MLTLAQYRICTFLLIDLSEPVQPLRIHTGSKALLQRLKLLRDQ